MRKKLRALSKLFNTCVAAIKPSSRETSEQMQSPWSRQRANTNASQKNRDSNSTRRSHNPPPSVKDATAEASNEEVNKNIPLKSLYQKLTYPMTNGQPPPSSGNPDKIARVNGECVRLSLDNESTDDEWEQDRLMTHKHQVQISKTFLINVQRQLSDGF